MTESPGSVGDVPRAESPPVRTRVKGKHLVPPRRPPAPVSPIASPTPYNVAVLALFPWAVATYPGILKGAWTLALGRAKPITIRDWRRGRRRAPQWALELLKAELLKRRESLDHALAILEKEKGRE